jgi:predicted CxxxxCH...CXXCH cytochrome family protein
MNIVMQRKTLLIALILFAGISFNSCSKLQNGVLSPVTSQVPAGVVYPHPDGWADSSSGNFHGTYFVNEYFKTSDHQFDLNSCASCHGKDLAGGLTKVSCYSCHSGSNGALSCETCHGNALNAAPPKDLSGGFSTSNPTVGGHQDHLIANELSGAMACSSCHFVPQIAGPGMHPTGGGVSVIFSGVAVTETNTPTSRYYDPSQPTVIPAPTFNFRTLQCANTYCHGNFKNGNDYTPTWESGDSTQAACGTCHGSSSNPAPNTSVHETAFYQGPSAQNCYLCHEPMMGPNGIQDSSLHVDGKLDLYGRSLTNW